MALMIGIVVFLVFFFILSYSDTFEQLPAGILGSWVLRLI